MTTLVTRDPDLLERAHRVGGEATKEATVMLALQEFIACRQQRGVVELFGKLEWDTTFHPKAERARTR